MIQTSSPFLSSVFTGAEQEGEALVLNLSALHDLEVFDKDFLIAFEDSLNRDDVYFRVEEDGVLLAELSLRGDDPILRFTKVDDPTSVLGFNPRATIEEQVQSIAEQSSSHVTQSRKTPGRAKSTYGGYRFVIGSNSRQNRNRALDPARSLKAKRASRRGLAKRIRAARKWHQGTEGKTWHKAQARYQQQHSSVIKSMTNFISEHRNFRFHKGNGTCIIEQEFDDIEMQPVSLRAYPSGRDLFLGEVTLFFFNKDNELHLVDSREVVALADKKNTLDEKEFMTVTFDPSEIGAPGYSLRKYKKEQGTVPWNVHQFFSRDERKEAARKVASRIQAASADPRLSQQLWHRVVYKGERRYKKEGMEFELFMQGILDGVGPAKQGRGNRHDAQIYVSGNREPVPVEIKNSHKTTFRVTELGADAKKGEISEIIVHRHPSDDDPENTDQIEVYMVEPRSITVGTPEKKGWQSDQRRIVANIKGLKPIASFHENVFNGVRDLEATTVHTIAEQLSAKFAFDQVEDMPSGAVYVERETGDVVISVNEHLLTDEQLGVLQEQFCKLEGQKPRVFEDHYDPMRILRECALSCAASGYNVEQIGPRSWVIDEKRIVFYSPKSGMIRLMPAITNESNGLRSVILNKTIKRKTASAIIAMVGQNMRGRPDYSKLRQAIGEGGQWYFLTEVPVNKLVIQNETDVKKEIEKSFDDVNPIVVGNDYFVIDGRHRAVNAKSKQARYIQAWVPFSIYEQLHSVDESLKVSLSKPNVTNEDQSRIASKNKGGDCYSIAANFVLDNEKNSPVLVHGEVRGQGAIEGIRYGHAWVEQGDTVIDNSTGRKLKVPKVVYYALGDISKTYKYSVKETRQQLLKYEHYGPWDLKSEY